MTLPFHIIFKIFRTHIKDTISAKSLTYQNISHTTYEAVSVFSAHGTWMYLQESKLFGWSHGPLVVI